MSRRVNAFVTIAFILFMAAAVISTFLSCQRNDSSSAHTPTEEASASSYATGYKTYIVKEYNGMVAVFEKGNAEPVKVTDRCVSALPEADRFKLVRGIEAASDTKLKRLLEDLCS